MRRLLSHIDHLSPLYVSTILFFITVIVYANTLSNGLFYDDEHFIYNNIYVTSFSFFNFFTESTTSGGGGGVSNYYRPLLTFLFSVQYFLFGNSGFIFHLVSLLLQAGCGILIYTIFKKIFNSSIPAFLTAILFIVHPIQTEAISYASGQGDPLSLFFLLLSITYVLKKKTKTALMLLGGSLLSKETGLLAPGFISLVLVVQEKNISFSTIKSVLLKSLPFWIASFSYFFLRLTILNFSNTLNFYNANNPYTESIFVRLNTFFHILPTYALLLVKPFPLFIDRNVSIYTTIDPTVIIVILILGIAVSASIYYFKKLPILFFSIGWTALGFIPTSGIIPINGIMYEHFLYYPSIGIFTLVSFGIYYLLTNRSLIAIPIFIILSSGLFYFSILTIQRNSDWHDPIRFYNQTLTYTESARIRNNLAIAYAESGDTKNAIIQYKKSVQISDTYPQTHLNLGNSYLALEAYTSAEQEYLKSIQLDPTFDRPYISLINLYKKTDQTEKIKNILKLAEDVAKKNKNFIPFLEYLRTQ